jgi:hypothetical protein
VDHATNGWLKYLKSFYLYSVTDSPHGLLKAGDDFSSRSSYERGISLVEGLMCMNPSHSHPQAKGAVCNSIT